MQVKIATLFSNEQKMDRFFFIKKPIKGLLSCGRVHKVTLCKCNNCNYLNIKLLAF